MDTQPAGSDGDNPPPLPGICVPEADRPRIALPPVSTAAEGEAPPKSLPAAPPPVPEDAPELPVESAEAQSPRSWRQWSADVRRGVKGFGASALAHAVLLIVLAVWQIAQALTPVEIQLAGGWTPAELPDITLPPTLREKASETSRVADSTVAAVVIEAPTISAPKSDAASSAPGAPSAPFAAVGPLARDVSAIVGNPGAGGFGGRAADARGRLVQEEGGNDASETAVKLGLEWLVAHQEESGGWRFNHNLGPCKGSCRHAGRHPSTTGATALALLPFFGAGQTHQDGSYQLVTRRGLYYLLNRIQFGKDGADLQEGTMYAQGMSAIALSEAYALTQDKSLQMPAQRALDFIVYAQDQRGGGWRYTPGQPGDTSMLGWQLMALRSGQMAYLRVPAEPTQLASHFLDTVQEDSGALYGYLKPGKDRATTAIGLLCRMYLGWKRDHSALERGIEHLDKWGPSRDDMYYNYYATQVMHHYGGKPWKKWNEKLRDYLIATQAKEGHERGSWYFAGNNGDVGGRLYNTAMAVMTLEVYYRHLPLYRQHAVDGF